MDSLRAYQDSVEAARLAAQARADSIARAREAEAARQRAVEAARNTLTQRVFFDYDESEIRADAETALRAKVAILRASPEVRLRIEGHADERGSTEYNMALGNRRAESVRQFLTGFGLAANRFEIVSFGEGRPLQSGSTEQAWSQNRRGEFVITAGANQINPAN
jgi:peptidoglycan-associated lipoprotein